MESGAFCLDTKMMAGGQEVGAGGGGGGGGGRGGDEAGSQSSEVALSVQSRGEGHVVEGPGDPVRPGVRSHAGDAVIRLVRRKLAAQLVR